jgi:DHA2 family multidrug resistance protein-like MFS transporter
MMTSGMRRWWALGALNLAVLAVGLDATVLNLALPTLASTLHASEAELQWFVAAFSLALAAGLLPAGLLADRYGRKKVLLISLAVFGAGSLACAYAPSALALIVARTVLGLGAAAMVPVVLATLTVLFSEAERPRAVGIWAASNFLALPLGPILGGYLLSHYWWGLVFLINVPVVLIGLVAIALLVPESRSADRPGLDLVGVLTSSLGLVGLTYGVIETGRLGWGDVNALAPLLAGVGLLVAFGLWESWLSRRPDGQPLVELALFQSASFTWGTILAGAGVFAMFGVLFTLPQYVQAILGLDAQGAGLRLLPLIGGLVVGAGLADRLAARVGAKLTVALGFTVLAGGLIAGAQTTVTSGDGFLLVWSAFCGAGVGLALATAADGALAALPPERTGVGSALMQAIQKVAVPLGAAVLGSVLNSIYQTHLDLTGLPPVAAAAVQKSVFSGIAVAHQLGSAPLLDSVRSAFVASMDLAMWVCAAVTLLGLVLALAFLPRRSRPLAQLDGEGAELEREVVART